MAGTPLSCHLLKAKRNLAATWIYKLECNFLSESAVWSHTVTKERKVVRLEMVSVAGNTTVLYKILLSQLLLTGRGSSVTQAGKRWDSGWLTELRILKSSVDMYLCVIHSSQDFTIGLMSSLRFQRAKAFMSKQLPLLGDKETTRNQVITWKLQVGIAVVDQREESLSRHVWCLRPFPETPVILHIPSAGWQTCSWSACVLETPPCARIPVLSFVCPTYTGNGSIHQKDFQWHHLFQCFENIWHPRAGWDKQHH